eukprot:365255-Chlamydomonas_euryale.AAC.15
MGVKRKALAAAGVLTGAAKGSSTGEDGPSSSAVESRVVYIGYGQVSAPVRELFRAEGEKRTRGGGWGGSAEGSTVSRRHDRRRPDTCVLCTWRLTQALATRFL